MLPLLIAAAAAAPLLLDEVRVVDARGDLGVHDVLLDGGHILALDPTEVPAGTARRDCADLTLVPGLVDAHVHLALTPGAALLPAGTDTEERAAQRLASALAWGVTTLVDPGITAQQARALLALDGPAPRLVFVGPLLGPDGGYPSAVIPALAGISTAAQVEALLDAYAALAPPGAKLTLEDGPAQRVWPLLDAALLATIQAQLRARGLQLWVHAMDPGMTRRALRLEPDVLVHASMRGGRRLARDVADSGAAVITTLDILAGEGWAAEPGRLDPQMLALTVPADQRRLLFDPSARRAMFERGLALYAPRLPALLRGPALGALERGRLAARRLRRAERFLRHLHEAGVPLVAGSDAGGSPIVPWLLHGASTHLELLALQRAGLSPLEVLTAATLRPAHLLGRQDQQGLVEPGMVADLVLVEGDPLADIAALQRPVLVIRAGEARTPAEWVGAADR